MKNLRIKINIFIYKYLLPTVIYMVDLIFRLIHSRQGKKSGVLLVRLDAIGDFVIWNSVAKYYSELYPDEKIILAGNAAWCDLAVKLPYWDEILSINTRKFSYNLFYRWQILQLVNNLQVRVVIQPALSRIFLTGDSIVAATDAPIRIGAIGDKNYFGNFGKNTSDKWYTTLIKIPDDRVSELDRNVAFLKLLGYPKEIIIRPYLPHMGILPSSLVFDGPYCVIFPGASSVGKQWPPDYFVSLIKLIQSRFNCTVVLCGDKSEFQLCENIASECGDEVVNIAGKTKLWEFVEVVRNCAFLVGNDTSAIHIAAAVNTRSICILGGGHFGRFHPYPLSTQGQIPLVVYHKMECFCCNWACYKSNDFTIAWPCISLVSVESVFEKIMQVYKN